MAEIYRVMFQNRLPRVLPEMEEMLEFSPYIRVGDWFLLKEHTIIKVYGFVHEPYILPTFLTPRILALEFIRHKLIMENEHFLRFRKAYEIKFPLKLGPFIIKNKVALIVVEILLQDMNFMKATKINSDPYHIISQRRKQNKNKAFEHHKIEGLVDRANLMDYQLDMEDLGNLQANPSAIITQQQ